MLFENRGPLCRVHLFFFVFFVCVCVWGAVVVGQKLDDDDGGCWPMIGSPCYRRPPRPSSSSSSSRCVSSFRGSFLSSNVIRSSVNDVRSRLDNSVPLLRLLFVLTVEFLCFPVLLTSCFSFLRSPPPVFFRRVCLSVDGDLSSSSSCPFFLTLSTLLLHHPANHQISHLPPPPTCSVLSQSPP